MPLIKQQYQNNELNDPHVIFNLRGWKSKHSNERSTLGPPSLNACMLRQQGTHFLSGVTTSARHWQPVSCQASMFYTSVWFILPPLIHCMLWFAPLLLLVYNSARLAFTPQTNHTRVQLKANQDPCAQVDQSLFVWSAPEFKRAFPWTKMYWTIQGNQPGFI